MISSNNIRLYNNLTINNIYFKNISFKIIKTKHNTFIYKFGFIMKFQSNHFIHSFNFYTVAHIYNKI